MNTEDDADIALTPPEDASPRIGRSPAKAGGLPAVTSALGHAFRKVGIFKGTRTLLRVNQTDGFDCPGCAWPDPAHRSTFEFCENGAKAVADEAMKASVDAAFFALHAVAELGTWSDFDLNRAGRIAEPVVLRPGSTHYERIGWDEAFALVAGHLNALAHPDQAVFYTSGRTSNEAAFMYQLFVRAFGTNNMPDCSNMCHESSGVGLNETIGIGKGTVRLEDFDHCDAIFVIGQNPGTNHPRMLAALQQAKRRGATIVTLNPLREAGLVAFAHPQEVGGLFGKSTPLTDLHLQVRVNGDVAALQGIMKAMLLAERERPGEVLAHDFIASQTIGFESFRAAIEARNWAELEASSGLSRAEMEAAAAITMRSRAIIACWAMGLTQHRNAVANVQEVVNFLLLGGHFGRPGAGACPVRGHSNVQGDRTVGITEKPSEAFVHALEKHFGISVPRHHGYSTVHAIHAMKSGHASVFVGLGGNFLSASPDTHATAEALRRCALTVHVATKLNRAHLVHGGTALILPCLGRTEVHQTAAGLQFVSVENSMGVVHASRGHNRPASPHLRAETDIVAGLARATLPASTIPWDAMAADLDRVRDAIEACIPGFEDYNRRVREPLGFELPNPPREGTFSTPDRRAHFTVHVPPVHRLEPGQFLMMTIRSHDQYNTTVYGLDDRYRGIRSGRRVVLMNPEDRAEAGLNPGQKVDIVSHFRGEKRRAPAFVVVDHAIARGAVATYFPEANVLVPLDSFAERSFTPTSKSVVVTLHSAS
jgi:molybdopterin-dependent oxidoreductase alpha subunit